MACVHNYQRVADHPPRWPEEPPASSGVTKREMRALHCGDGKGMESLTEGLTKYNSLVLTESLKDLQGVTDNEV